MKLRFLKIQFLLLMIPLYMPSQTITYLGNWPANYIISDNIFELIEDCLGKNKFKEILNEEKGRSIFLSYDLNGNLRNINTGRIFDHFQKAYFLEEEWENIFDYFDNLPPLPLSNPVDYINEENKYYNLDIAKFINRIVDVDGHSFECRWDYDLQGHCCPKDEPFYDWFKKSLYSYDFNVRKENPDFLFGNMHWYELSGRYYDKYNAGYLESTQPKNEYFKQSGYCWTKIPIKNYTVNLQVPINSKITIAPDTLSATVNFPNSTHVFIQYTKGLPYTKLWYGEDNPRKRLINELIVRRKHIISSGSFELDGICIRWIRIRYRYGITITIYSKCINWDNDYYKTVIIPATVVLRPKFKTIFLKD